jgi:hypothetical protein
MTFSDIFDVVIMSAVWVRQVPQEVLSCTIENVSFYSPHTSREFRLMVGHVQIDNMLDVAKYKVVFASSNSGRNR